MVKRNLNLLEPGVPVLIFYVFLIIANQKHCEHPVILFRIVFKVKYTTWILIKYG